MRGTDQQASIEPLILRLIKDIRSVEQSLGKPLKLFIPKKSYHEKIKKIYLI